MTTDPAASWDKGSRSGAGLGQTRGMGLPRGNVTAVSRSDAYSFTKPVRDEIVLLAGIGIEGDVHAGVRVRHRFRVRNDPTQPNLRQVHLIQGELFGEVGAKGFRVMPGDLGENVTTGGIDLLALPVGTILRFGLPPEDAADAGDPDAGDPDDAGDAAGSGIAVLGDVLAAAEAATLDEATARAAAAVRTVAERDSGTDRRPAVIVAGLRNPCQQINGFQPGLLKEVIGKDEDRKPVYKAGVMGVVLRGGPIRPGDPVGVELPPLPHAPLERV
jgi:hypothetical protein